MSAGDGSKRGKRQVALPEQLTVAHLGALKQQIDLLLKEASEVEIDLAPVIKVDTAGLQCLLALAAMPAQRLHWRGHSPAIGAMIDLYNLRGVLPADFAQLEKAHA